jgi:hypothetical protein
MDDDPGHLSPPSGGISSRFYPCAHPKYDVLMSHDQTPDESESAVTFLGFVVSLAHTAAVHFGDVPDPVSGETIPANLPAAQQMIDILSLLEEKTRGNLTAEERQLLEQILYELRLRYVEVSKQGTAAEPSRIIIP